MKKQLLVFLFVLLLFQTLSAQTQYNDGRIRLRVWVHKVWSSANCSDPGEQEYVFRNISVRPRTDILGTGWSSSGVNIRANMDENRWMGFPWSGYQVPAGTPVFPMTVDPLGILLMDITYPNAAAPTSFDWSVSQTFENDCGDDWQYESSCGFLGLLGDENLAGYHQGIAVNPFRAGPVGSVYYVQTDVIDAGPSEDDKYSIIFAFQWDWIDPFPPLPNTCGAPKYKDGNVQLDVEMFGVWCDVDYDMGLDCVMGLAGDEDLRVAYRSKDNTSAFSPWTVINQNPGPLNLYNQGEPQWNSPGPVNILSKTYNTSSTNFESFEIEFEAWEEDPFPTDEFVYESDDDAHLPPTSSGVINWRSSPPNTWNYLDFPVRAGSGGYENWTMWIRYKWTQGAPAIVTQPSAGGADRSFCTGTSTTLSVVANSSTYYQWQITSITGPAGPTCPTTGWTDIPGANCPDYVPPQTPGTRIYRCALMNRTGPGSTGPSGDRLNVIFTDCVRVTYFDYAPPITSPTAVCNSTVLPNSTHVFSIPAVPATDAVANANFTWSANGPAPVTPSPATGTSTSITFPSAPGTYTITCTVNNSTLNCAPNTANEGVTTCLLTVTEPDCGVIHVSPSGNPSGVGTISDPVTIQQAVMLANSSAGARPYIKVLAGTYNNIPKLLITLDSLLIDGDYEVINGEWRKNSKLSTTINLDPVLENLAYNGGSGIQVGVYKGIEAVNADGFIIQDIYFNVKNGIGSSLASGTTDNRGRSVYGFYVSNCNGYAIRRCTMNTGAGTKGTDGSNGSSGVNGSAGGNGESGDCDEQNDVGDGGAGGAGAGGTYAPGTNVDNGCCNSGTAGSPGGNAVSLRNGGGGGSGGSAGSEANNGANGGNGGNGGGGATGGNAYGGGGQSAGDGENCNRDGRRGQNGIDGGNGANASSTAPASSTTFSLYWLPNGQSANGSDGAGGAGGESGGGGSGQGGTWAVDGAGSGGGGGGGGGQGGQAGTGGWGGGASFALYTYGPGTGTLRDVVLNNGAAGNGGTKGSGGSGGNGGTGGLGGGGNNDCLNSGNCCTGGRVCGNCEVGAGGRGGSGGNGGTGGDGQPGANGISTPVQNVNSSVVSSGNVSPVSTDTLISYVGVGCTNSEIMIYKNSGNPFDFADMGNPQLIDDISLNISSYANGSGQKKLMVSYPDEGHYKITLDNYNTNDWESFIYINQYRSLPAILGINGNEDTICNGQAVDLATTVGGAEQYEWSIEQISGAYSTSSPGPDIFGGSQIFNPAPQILNNPGPLNITYQIRLRIKDKCCGWSKPVYKFFTVLPDLSAGSIGYDQNICDITIPDTLSGINPAYWGVNNINYIWEQSFDSLNWIPANGLSINSGNDFVPTQALAGTVYYRRKVNGGPCGDKVSNTVTITINPLPVVNANSNDPDNAICQGDSIILFGSGTAHIYTWSQGITDSVAFAPTSLLQYGVMGTDTLSGCSSTDSIYIAVYALPNPALTSNSPVCLGDTLIIAATPGVDSYQWTGPGGFYDTVQTIVIPSASFSDTGTYHVTVTTIFNCSASGSIHALVLPRYYANITADTFFCTSAASVIFSGQDPGGIWSGNGINSVSGLFNPAAAGSGVHTITYSIGGQCGDSDTISVNVMQSSDASFNLAGPFCINEPAVNLTPAQSGGTWWGNGITNNILGTFNPSAAGTGTHIISYGIAGICGDTVSNPITVLPLANASINPSGPFCENSNDVMLSAAQSGGLWWGNGISDSVSGLFSPLSAGPGVHTVIYYIGGQCGSSDTSSITIHAAPQLNIFAKGESCNGKNDGMAWITVYGGSPPYSILWENGTVNDTAINLAPDNWTVSVTDLNNCSRDSNVTVVASDSLCYKPHIWAPNIFSPNGDGNNDIFLVRGDGVTEFSLIIYDRWGEKVFESSSLDIGWDGTYKGKMLNTGVFVYYLHAKFSDNTEKNIKGNVTIVH